MWLTLSFYVNLYFHIILIAQQSHIVLQHTINMYNTPYFPELTYSANYGDKGGKILITPNEVIFKPNSLNFGNKNEVFFFIKDICGYEKGFLTQFSIFLSTGYRMDLAVWKKDEIIRALEERRHAHYNSLGLQTPPLTMGSYQCPIQHYQHSQSPIPDSTQPSMESIPNPYGMSQQTPSNRVSLETDIENNNNQFNATWVICLCAIGSILLAIIGFFILTCGNSKQMYKGLICLCGGGYYSYVNIKKLLKRFNGKF